MDLVLKGDDDARGVFAHNHEFGRALQEFHVDLLKGLKVPHAEDAVLADREQLVVCVVELGRAGDLLVLSAQPQAHRLYDALYSYKYFIRAE